MDYIPFKVIIEYLLYGNSPTYESSSCELSMMQTCICIVYIVMFMNPLEVVAFLCTLLYSMVQSPIVQYPYFKPRMSRSKCKSISGVVDTTVFFKILYCKILNVYFLWVFFLHLCEKYYKPITVQYQTEGCQLLTQANFMGLMNKLVLRRYSRNRTCSYVEELLCSIYFLCCIIYHYTLCIKTQ